ncbi:MAG: ATP-binding protein [Eubacteriales bacterium]|nr:ATP-binding protein [Eubacteriales bacterium]
MKSSLLRKILLIFLTFVMVFVLLTSSLYVIISRTIYTDMKEQELSPKAATIAGIVLAYRKGEIPFTYFQSIISAGPSAWDAWVFVLDNEGNMIIQTRIPVESDPNRSFVTAIESKTPDVLSGNKVNFTGSLPNDKFRMMIVGVPVMDGTEVTGAVFLAKPLYEINAGINSLNRALLISTLICLLLMGFPVVFAFNRLIRPLKETRDAALALADGNFKIRAEIHSDDEIGDLASSFNFLAERLEKTVSDLTTERNRLMRILNGLAEGIIAVDINCNVTHANPALWKLIHTRQLGQTYDGDVSASGRAIMVRPSNPQFIRKQVISDERVWDDFRNVILTSVPAVREIDRNGSIIRIIITPIEDETGNNTGAVAMLTDITEATLLEQTRKDYIANISHELRTPLTAMRGLVEPLADGLVKTEEDRMRYYSIILRETMRLSRLIEDMMELSRLQSGNTTIDTRQFDIADIVSDIIDKYKVIAADKGITLECTDELENLPPVSGNPDRTEQVLVILIDNALKFTGEGGHVIIGVKPDRKSSPSKLLVSVSDNGPGIDADVINNVFDRFFKADKARYGTAGTGLGLSIAKEILGALGESITVKSHKGKGTVFTFTIKIRK